MKDVTSAIVGKKGIENVGPSKFEINLKPSRPTTLLLRFKTENAHSVDFKVNGAMAQVC